MDRKAVYFRDDDYVLEFRRLVPLEESRQKELGSSEWKKCVCGHLENYTMGAFFINCAVWAFCK